MTNINKDHRTCRCAKTDNAANASETDFSSPLLQEISDDRVIFLDGAMGTMLQESGSQIGRTPGSALHNGSGCR